MFVVCTYSNDVLKNLEKINTSRTLRGTPLNRLIDDMTTVMLAEFDAETRFRLRAARGKGQEALGLQLLAKSMAS